MLDQMDRRTLMQQAVLLIGATAVPSQVWAATAGSPSAESMAKHQLDPARFELLSAFADLIIPATDTPGALEAGVPGRLDAMIGTWATAERKAELLGALDAIDVLAKSRFQRRFTQLTPAERDVVLTPHDKAALVAAAPAATVVDLQTGQAKQQPVPPVSYVAKGRPRYADPAYARLKELVVVLFYLSETALTNDLGYEHDPGAWEPSIPVTPTTRPWGGVGAN